MLNHKQLKLIKNSGNIRYKCQEIGISTSTFYRYLKIYKKNGKQGLKAKSKRPKNTQKTPKSIERKIILKAKSGKYKHASEITRVLNSVGIDVCNNTVLRILRDENLFGEVLVETVRDGMRVKLYAERIISYCKE